MEYLQGSLSPSSSSTSSSVSLDLHPLSIDSELWLLAESRIQEIICTIQPALASERKRKEVIDYIQRLIKGFYATEVFPFGSVPLKTYLPDGDIDLTTLSHQNREDDLARDICCILQCQEQDPEFQVTDVQYIQAQVKVIKCTVKNISVDISFNQMAGLCTLCFLEQVDQLIGRNHLFKRSIILIKAWCFYESRILGAHHGLISTYALEILVLFIINLFHSSLPGPLAVLHRFLDYYSTFDWEHFCIGINGPIAISSLPDITAVSPETNGKALLLSQEFLRNCRELFSVPIEALENASHEFPVKHLNIVDPLKDSNNLGRSVSKGNFHRIRCALSYGAQRLGEILIQPGESMGGALERFFANTLDRNGKGQRPDAEVPVPAFGTGRFEVCALTGDYHNHCSGLLRGQWYHNYTLPVPSHSISTSSQVHQKHVSGVLSRWKQCNQNVLYQRGTDVFIPRVPPCHPHASQLYDMKLEKSRGTGTYIPDMANHHYRDLASRVKAKNPNSPPCSPSLRSIRKMDPIEDAPEAENSGDSTCCNIEIEKYGNGCYPNFSLDQFPLLCIKKPMSPEIHQPSQPSSAPVGTVEFDAFELSSLPLSLSSSVTRKQVDSGVSTALETMPAAPEREIQMLQALWETAEDRCSIPLAL